MTYITGIHIKQTDLLWIKSMKIHSLIFANTLIDKINDALLVNYLQFLMIFNIIF